ncbi:hypothetical protein CspeluHIS016_0702290 [Cutaneotrichosporon spelunceum]|uniref:RNA polymerase II subunit B1 CTD phosphatase RPAP2 homolog n=1 Tax=Cutaneotrichosporon spelunceum TaxID=1672016 RepID=A0AAD3YEN9_9TREE|nr:hypothetical protein CspeluHIS016_0702290 [Cutaneotrichosporon spelunceum]
MAVPPGAMAPRLRPQQQSAQSQSQPQPRPQPRSQSQPRTHSTTPAQSTPQLSRTLKQPMTLRVAETAMAGAGDKAELRRAFENRIQTARRADKWADRVMEEVLDRETLVKALSYLYRTTYLEAQHERHLNSLCAYPTCPRPPAAPYRSGKRFVVSTTAHTITERDGNDDQAFCSRKCATRSAYILQQLGNAAPWLGPGNTVELLEDAEERGDVVWTKNGVLSWVKKEGVGKGGGKEEDKDKDKDDKEKGDKEDNDNNDKDTLSLLAGLSIVERATPTTPPVPPGTLRLPVEPGAPVAMSGTGELAGLPLPLPGGEVRPSPMFSKGLTPAPAPATSVRRATSSLLSTEHAGLAASVLSASRKMTVVESDESEAEEEWAKAMGWGSGPEVDALFAVAAESRRLQETESPAAESSK